MCNFSKKKKTKLVTRSYVGRPLNGGKCLPVNTKITHPTRAYSSRSVDSVRNPASRKTYKSRKSTSNFPARNTPQKTKRRALSAGASLRTTTTTGLTVCVLSTRIIRFESRVVPGAYVCMSNCFFVFSLFCVFSAASARASGLINKSLCPVR